MRGPLHAFLPTVLRTGHVFEGGDRKIDARERISVAMVATVSDKKFASTSTPETET